MITSLKVPMLESGAALLLLELSDADASIGKIVHLAEMSPAIAAKLLSCANSPWSKPVTPITTVAEACARLGLNVVRTTTIALSIGQPFNPNRCPSFDAQRFWCTSIIASNLAVDLAPAAGVEPSTARTAALLQNIGMLWLADALPSELDAALICASEGTDCTISQYLRDSCGSTRKESSLYLFKAWDLPEILQSALDTEDSDNTLAKTAGLAETLATDIFDGTPADQSCRLPDDEAMHTIYEKHLRTAQDVRELAATLF
jgi:HD-like signal output (HDOD) protein